MTGLQVVILSLAVLAQLQCQPRPQGWETFPLTAPELSLLISDQTRQESLAATNQHNQTCLISPGQRGEAGTGGCTWRSERRCKRVPTTRTVPVFSPWCSKRDEAGQLSRCRETVQRRPLVSRVRVCTPTGTPDCRGPCQDCPDYCQPVQQSWCELEHTISTRLSDREDCRHNNKPNEPCEKVLIRVEKDVVTSNENCYQKDSELCGPQNCKFVNLTMNCHEKNSSVEVELLERECVICQPKLAETIEVIEVCEEVLTDDCATDPLSKTWRKICNTGKSEIISDGISFQFVTTEKTDISVADLVRGSIQPVDNLFSETLKKFLTTTQRTTTASSEEISEILNLLREPKRKEEITTKAGVSPEQSTRPSSIYFDPILNTRPLQHRPVQNISRPSFTESLNSQLQNQFETEKSQQKFETSNTFTSVTEVTTSAPETTKVFTIVPVSVATSTTTTTTTQTTTTVPTRKVSQTTPESRSTQSTTLATEKTTTTKTKLSPADFLKLCFISQIGCDFSQNEISSSTTTTTTTTTSSPRPESTTERVERVTKISSERQEKLRQRLQLCFLSGICGDGEVQESLASEQKERLTTELPTSTSRRIDTEIQRKVQERARACFFQGKCN